MWQQTHVASHACIVLLSLVLAAWASAGPSEPALGQSEGTDMYVYVDDLPDWAPYAANVMHHATTYWEERIPGLEFYRVDDPMHADFRVQWVKEFGVEHVGYAYGSGFIEVGLGDSNCLDQWSPFSTGYVSHIMIHEIGHILGYGHTDDPGSVMYPVALNKEYGLVEHEESFAENYGRYIPLCTSKPVTSFDFYVSTDDPKHGFDVYFVPGPDSLEKWSRGEPFEYYSDESCFGKNYLQYGATCEDVSGDGGLMIITDDAQSSSLTTITIQLQEVLEDREYGIAKPPSVIQEYPDPPDMTNSYSLFVDPHKRYTMQYPSTWIVDDAGSGAYQAGFYNNGYRDSTAAAFVLLYEGGYTGYTDDEILDAIIEHERNLCREMTYSENEQICHDFEVISDNTIQQASGHDVYTVAYSSTRQYKDALPSDESRRITMLAEMHDGSRIWNVIAESDASAFERHSGVFANMIGSFQLTSVSDHGSGHADGIPIPREHNPGPGAFDPPTGSGSGITSDQGVYVIGPASITTYAKISGNAGQTDRGDKVTITYTSPDGTTNGNVIHPTKDGYFEALLPLDGKSPPGTYEALASINGRIIGIVTFDVTNAQAGYGTAPHAADADAGKDDSVRSPAAKGTHVTVVDVGVLLPATGDLSIHGNENRIALDLAASDFNEYLEEGGADWRINLVIADTQSDPAQALEVIRSLNSKGIKYALGPESSAETRRIMSYVNANDMIILSPSSTSPALAMSDNIFRFAPDDTVQGRAVAALLADGGIKVMIPTYRDDAWGSGVYESAKTSFEEMGGTVVGAVRFNPDAAGYAAEADILSRKAENVLGRYDPGEVGVLVIGFDEVARLFDAAADHKVLGSVSWFGSDGNAGAVSIIDDMHAARFAGSAGFTAPLFAPSENAVFGHVQSSFVESTGRMPSSNYAYASYDSLWVLGLSMEASGFDPLDIRDQIPTTVSGYTGALGAIRLNDAGDLAMSDYEMWSVVDGMWMPTARYDAATDKIITYHSDDTIADVTEPTAGTNAGIRPPAAETTAHASEPETGGGGGGGPVPEWIKISAGWWADGALDDDAFLQSIQYLASQGVIKIQAADAAGADATGKIPQWTRAAAGWWAQGHIDDDTFVQSVQFLVQSGIIVVAESK